MTVVARAVTPSEPDEKGLKERIRLFVREALGAEGGFIRAAVIGLPGKVSPDKQSCAVTYLDLDRYVSFRDLFVDLGGRARNLA